MAAIVQQSTKSHLHLDHYLIAGLYSSWEDGEHTRETVFELFFRKNPFKGEYTIFTGLTSVIEYLERFKIDQERIRQFKSIPQFAEFEEGFWQYLESLDTKSIKLYAINEGSVCFPHVPLIKVTGPLGLVELIGTALMSLTGYASLVTTNATRFRLATDAIQLPRSHLFEFGLRRAQGPDAGLIASRSAYIGGFDGTSNLDAHQEFGIPTCGTIGHTSVLVGVAHNRGLNKDNTSDHRSLLNKSTNKNENFTLRCLEVEEEFLKRVVLKKRSLEEDQRARRRSELRSFIKVALTNKEAFLGLVDTYDVLRSGLVNYCIVALALIDFGYKPLGVRIDSGDLAYLSRCARSLFKDVAEEYKRQEFDKLDIIVSNEINVKVILSLLGQKHAISGFGIGTNLVTCGKQPSLGTVFKLVEIDGVPCQKSSSFTGKTMIAFRKSAYRLYSAEDQALVDLLVRDDEPIPLAGREITCRHPFDRDRQCVVKPTRVEPLLHLWWDGQLTKKLPGIEEIRKNCSNSLAALREDIKRFVNPTPYKVSVSEELFDHLSRLKANLLAT